MNSKSQKIKPRILISSSTNPRLTGLRRFDSIGGLNYAEAISSLGGVPFFAPNLAPDLATDYIAHSDALLLSGGADFDPNLYGQDPQPDLGLVEQSRDLFELELYQAAKHKGIPILGICRGIQAINIAEGGSLHQHIPALNKGLQHNQQNIDGSLSHEISVAPNSLLAKGFGKLSLRTNSYHHQAIDSLGENLNVIARASDGIIEGVEGTSSSFVLGVQWHPEMSFERFPEQLVPFRLFMDEIHKLQAKIPKPSTLTKTVYV